MKLIGMLLSFAIIAAMAVMYTKYNDDQETRDLDLQIQIDRAVMIALVKGTDA
jgi:hypothetical protein